MRHSCIHVYFYQMLVVSLHGFLISRGEILAYYAIYDLMHDQWLNYIDFKIVYIIAFT